MPAPKYPFVVMNDELLQYHFSCGTEKLHQDLNHFFKNDALAHQEQLLAKTYVWIDPEQSKIVAFVAVRNDIVSSDSFVSSSQARKMKKKLPHAKRFYEDYPAVKIARLAVNLPYKNQGIGSQILYWAKQTFSDSNNKTGCRFMTIDAVPQAVSFYEKNGFIKIPLKTRETKEGEIPTELMYYDLKKFTL